MALHVDFAEPQPAPPCAGARRRACALRAFAKAPPHPRVATATERAKELAEAMKQALREAKAAAARARELGDAVLQALAEARAEAQQARTIVEYPTGRYECKHCRQSVLFTEPTAELPACQNCGSREYLGAAPTITRIQPPAPKQYPAGMYECDACKTRVVLAFDVDVLSPCEFCGANKLHPAA